MKKILLSIAILLGVMAGGLAQPVLAEGVCDDPNIAADVKEAAGCNIDKDYNIANPIQDVLNVVLGLVGVIAVGIVIYGGILYMKSAGDTAKVMQGRRAIIGGIVGLLIALLAFAIVNFVIQGIK